jgi:hypothetical protein
MDSERKLIFLKTHKNLYTVPLSITDEEYGDHDKKIRSFGQFCRKLMVFGKIIG